MAVEAEVEELGVLRVQERGAVPLQVLGVQVVVAAAAEVVSLNCKFNK